MKKNPKPELRLENLSVVSGAPRRHLLRLVNTLAREVEQNQLKAGTVVSVGNYGHIRLEADYDEKVKEVLLIRDVEAGSSSANSFVARMMALLSFDLMDNGAWSEAMECLDYALELKPDDPTLLQARAQVKGELARGTEMSSEAANLVMDMLGDLLRSIELAPNRAEAYRDLLWALKGFRPADGGDADHRQWISTIVDQALSYPAQNPEAIAAREALRAFESGAG